MALHLRTLPPAADDVAQHAAFGAELEELNIVVIEASRTMQGILRSMLAPCRPKRIRIYDVASDGLRDMLVEPPNLIITDWNSSETSGYRLLRILRHRSMAPLCFVPIVVVTGQATRSAVETACRTGAQAVMVKPVSPAALRRRIEWVTQDERSLKLEGENYIIDGIAELLDAKRAKERLPAIVAELRRDIAPIRPDALDSQEPNRGDGVMDADWPAALLGGRDKKRRDAKSSATLHRLMRRRDEIIRPPQAPAREKIILKSRQKYTKTKTRWSDLWGM